MVQVNEVAFGVVTLAIGLWFGYRAAVTARLYRSLSGVDPYQSAGAVEGETAAVEGEVVVDEPVGAGGALTDADAPVGAFVWRVRSPERGNEFTIDSDGIAREMDTYESGVESGAFAIVDGGREIRVDLDRLAAEHDSTALSKLSLEGFQTSTPLSDRTWDSPYLHLEEYTELMSLDETDLVDEAEADLDPAGFSFESKAVPEGTRLAVRGEVAVEQGEPVIRGTDDTPLALSDRGFDGLGSDLRVRIGKYGALAVLLLGTAALLLLRGFSILSI